MSRFRSSMVLLGICVIAILIGVLRLATNQPAPPSSSSYSADPEGTLAFYTWLTDLGANTQRLQDTAIDPNVQSLVIVQPETLVDPTTRRAFDAVADRGGTIVLAGDSVQWLFYARALRVEVDPAPASRRLTTPDGLTLIPFSRFRLQAADAEPLLIRDDGDWAALRMPYRQGTLIVIGSSLPFTNAGLSDDNTAQFVFRTVIQPLQAQTVAFDEIQRSPVNASEGPATINSLLFQTAPGLAIVYVALLTFAFLVLAGRRLGPPLRAPSAAESQRTMYEHVQMLANLYRRAGQFAVVRAAFGQHYARIQARGGVNSRRAAAFDQALDRVKSARTESELVAAVSRIDDAL